MAPSVAGITCWAKAVNIARLECAASALLSTGKLEMTVKFDLSTAQTKTREMAKALNFWRKIVTSGMSSSEWKEGV